MADTGAPHFIPFADPTDLVRDWPALSEDVADAVAAGLTAAGNAGIGSNVVSVAKTDTFSMSSATFADVTGLSATITPTSETSRMLVIVSMNVGSTISTHSALVRLRRDSTNLFIGDAEGSRNRASSSATENANSSNSLGVVFLDSPSVATPVEYKIQLASSDGDRLVTVNRTVNDTNAVTTPRLASSITVIEVAP